MARRTEIDPDTGMEVEYDDGLPEFGAQAVPLGNPPPVLITNMRDGVRQDQVVSREMTPEDIATWDKKVKGPMRTGISESGSPWASNVVGWEPPPSKPDLMADMPKLYNQQKARKETPAIPGPPPGEPGFNETTRAKFLQHAIKEIGFNPLTIRPEEDAEIQVYRDWVERNSFDNLSESRKKDITELLTNQLGRTPTIDELRKVSPEQIDKRGEIIFSGPGIERTRERFKAKKVTGMEQLKFMMDQFDKDMEWKPIGAGGSFQPGTGETISPFREPKTPNEIELTQRALKGDIEAQRTLEAMASRRLGTKKAGQNWILPNRTTVISYDEGRSYVASDGQEKRMPSSAIKVPGGATLGELKMNEAKKQAVAELEIGTTGIGKSPKGAALEGTGPYNRLASAFEAVAGGLGVDILVGQQGFFPDMADAKQYLRSVKQMGKAALMNSARGAIWEQQRIDELFPDPDKTFTNPRIEARKFGNLMSILSQEKTFNNQAIIESLTPKEVEKYRTSNNEIDRLLSLISEPSTGISTQDRTLIDKYLKRMKK